MAFSRTNQRRLRHRRVRRKVRGSAERPRLAVFASGKHLYVQFIDDEAGHTLAALSTLTPELREQDVKSDLAGAAVLGKEAAARARQAGIERVVFDRGGMRYHGRLKALAEAAREGGLQF